MRPESFSRPWSRRELAIMRRVYPTATEAQVQAALPGRTRYAIWCKAQKLGLKRPIACAVWTPEETEKLRSMWGWETIPNIARALSKSTKSIFFKSVTLGLKMVVPEGYAYVTDAAARSGFSFHAFQTIMRLYHVRLRPHYGRARKGRHRHHHIVDLEAADAAIAKYLATENLHQAAKSRGTDTRRLHRLLALIGAEIVKTGEGPKAFHRAKTVDIDRALAEGDAYEWIREGARRHGVHPSSLRRWLIARGCKRLGHSFRVRKADVDAVVATERARREEAAAA